MSSKRGIRTARTNALIGPTTEVFDGDKSLEQWVSHFENVVAING